MKVLIFLILAAVLSGCVVEYEHPGPIYVRTAGAISGEDTRTPIGLATSLKKKKAESVAAIIAKGQVRNLSADEFMVEPVRFDNEFCAGEQFSHEPRYTSCTAFKIADHLVATAAHCLNERTLDQFCEDFDLVFDFNTNSVSLDGDKNAVVAAKNRVDCVGVAFYSNHNMREDVAIIEISPRDDIPNLSLSLEKPQLHEDVYMIGHGSGYLANTHSGVVRSFNFYSNEFDTDNDAFGGDSGSPVISANTGEVLGVHSSVRFGHMLDRILDIDNRCFLTPRFSNQELPFGAGNFHKFASNTLLQAQTLLSGQSTFLEDGRELFLDRDLRELITYSDSERIVAPGLLDREERYTPLAVPHEVQVDFEFDQLTDFERLSLAFWSFETRDFELFLELVKRNPRLNRYGWDSRPNFRAWRPRQLQELITRRFSTKREHLNRGFYAALRGEERAKFQHFLSELIETEFMRDEGLHDIRRDIEENVIPMLAE